MVHGLPLMYGRLASWWPLLSRPADYKEEAESFLALMDGTLGARARTVVELGCGGGNLASHLKGAVALTLTDVSPEMLAVSRTLNPDVEHLVGDMRSLDLGRTFDVVLVHDAIMYCRTPAELQAALATAARHCRPGGVAVLAPDCTRESYTPDTTHGGEDGDDGRALRYLSWSLDPDPSDTTFETLYSIVMREADGTVETVLDRHVEGFFREAEWLAWLREAGFDARVEWDRWERPVFIGRRA